MKKMLLAIVALGSIASVNAQSYVETFDSNSLEWTESASENNAGSAIIDKGVLTVTSFGERKGMSAFLSAASGTNVKVGTNTFFETHCYAPLDVQKPFKVRAHVKIGKLEDERAVGFVFNYKDGGTFYCFDFDEEMVRFQRYVDNRLVGAISQGVKWTKKKKAEQEWELQSDGSTLVFIVDGLQILKVRYMPLEYAGFGFYTFGKQKLIVDDMEFIQ